MSEQPEAIGTDGFREECGVFGIYGHPDAANLTYLGLYALQHRGQEAGGIAAWNGKRIVFERGMDYLSISGLLSNAAPGNRPTSRSKRVTSGPIHRYASGSTMPESIGS